MMVMVVVVMEMMVVMMVVMMVMVMVIVVVMVMVMVIVVTVMVMVVVMVMVMVMVIVMVMVVVVVVIVMVMVMVLVMVMVVVVVVMVMVMVMVVVVVVVVDGDGGGGGDCDGDGDGDGVSDGDGGGDISIKESASVQVREANGTAWPCFMSDVALARVLRGNEGYFSEATNWFQKFLTKMDKWGVDEIARDVTAKMAQAERGSLTMLPHAEEVGRHFRCVFSAPRLTPAGDVIWYLPLSDFDRQGLVDQVEWKHWEEFVRAMIVLRAAEAQKLSQAQHRLAKCVTILDLHGSGIGTTGVPKVESFDEPNQKNMKFMRQIVIDILGPVYVLNAPWVAVKAFNWFKSLVPERFSRKVILLDGDGTYDDDFVEMVGEAQLKHLLATRIGLLSGETDADAGECSIGAGESLNKCRDLKCGETIAWSFTVESGDADGWLGVSDIVFSAKMMFHPDFNREEVEEEGQGTLALEETTVQASNGQVTGKYTAARDGVVTLCWSNEHSRMRTKGVQFQIDLQR